jgi:hypothetical protein
MLGTIKDERNGVVVRVGSGVMNGELEPTLLGVR